MSDLTPEELAVIASAFDMAREGQAEELADFVDSGLPVNLTNEVGDTLLILGAYYRNAEVVRALLARGADTSRVNDRGQSAVGAAVFRQDEQIVRMLLAAGADPGLGAQSGHAVADYFNLPEMKALLSEAAAEPGDAVP
ncbi:ankyrin repeat domain-containing protein [Gephyromycinifex aptenodytis]|uniref:ankyrin repeat domain-containing protein n=1 Tax=Gephyromycinifex aptenodytis TaxID=2716227 RepID=UPI0014470C81|nr:ankyrin repeat domain-containing protein [Gephyromycinifex aptenodytis]